MVTPKEFAEHALHYACAEYVDGSITKMLLVPKVKGKKMVYGDIAFPPEPWNRHLMRVVIEMAWGGIKYRCTVWDEGRWVKKGDTATVEDVKAVLV